jgi:hypothetical protein
VPAAPAVPTFPGAPFALSPLVVHATLPVPPDPVPTPVPGPAAATWTIAFVSDTLAPVAAITP